MGRPPKKRKENDRNILLTAKNAANVVKMITMPCKIRLNRRIPIVIQATSSSEPIKLRKCRVMLKRVNLEDHTKVCEPGSPNAISSLKRKHPEISAQPEITTCKKVAFDTAASKETAKPTHGRHNKSHSIESQRIVLEKENEPKGQRNDKQKEQSKNASLNTSAHRKFFISGPRDHSRSVALAVATTPVKPRSHKIDLNKTTRRDITSRANISTIAAKTRMRQSVVKLIKMKVKDGFPGPSALRQKGKADTEPDESLRSQSPDLFSDEETYYQGDVYSFPSQSSVSEVEDPASDVIAKLKKEGKVVVSKAKRQVSKPKGKGAVKPAKWQADVYSFPSQSSVSEAEDPAADVIAKLKKEGKVVVSKAKRQGSKPKGKGAVKPAKWQAVVRNLPKATTPNAKKPTTTVSRRRNQPRNIPTKNIPPIVTFANDDDHFADNFEHFELNVSSNPIARIEKQTVNTSFSALAQKTLRNEMVKANATSTPDTKKVIRPAKIQRNKAELLEMARSFIRRSAFKNSTSSSAARQLSNHSTPNRLPAQSSTSVNHSIRDASNIAPSSPWRVNSEQIPRLFYFSRSKDDLPSYSSDVMPSSQPSNKPHDLLNISNIENISPVKSIENRQNAEKALIGLNPRRSFAARSPLKPINVLSVVTLPYRATVKPADKATANKENVESFSNEKSDIERNESQVIDDGRNDQTSKDITANFFGFYDRSFELNDDPLPAPKTNMPSKRRLHDKLSRLRQLLPPKPTRLSYNTIQTVFKPIEKQTDIREMLSSTKVMPDESNAEISSFIDVSRHEQSRDCGQDPSSSVDREIRLFEEPETTFDRSIKVKTYQRVPKRNVPRKCHNFVLFSSEEEDEDVMPVRKKRTKADKKQQKELKEFVHEFNSMCDEVDGYELVVEKDKTIV